MRNISLRGTFHAGPHSWSRTATPTTAGCCHAGDVGVACATCHSVGVQQFCQACTSAGLWHSLPAVLTRVPLLCPLVVVLCQVGWWPG